MFRQFIFLILHLPSCKLLIGSFGGYWTLLPAILGKLFLKPVFIILNGTDCASLPQINYGELRKPLLRKVCKASYKWASLLLPVSKSLVFIKNTYYSDDKTSYQGIKHFFPGLETNIEIVSNGFDDKFWMRDKLIKKEKNTFLAVFSADQFVLKGGDLIIEIAKQLPEYKFLIAGLDHPPLKTKVSKNVSFLGYLDTNNLKHYYSKSRFYFQLSIYEGFGCALCEAMLCECVPIVSSVNILPEIIGDTGFVLMKRKAEDLLHIIQNALNTNDIENYGKKARERIISDFPVRKRQQKLKKLIDKYIH